VIAAMALLDRILRAFFDAALLPFRGAHPLVGLSIVSLAAAVLVLLVVKRTSDQPALTAVKRQILAGFFEMRLFADDPRALLSTQWELLRHNLRYLRLSLAPMLWLIAPFFLLVAQLQFQYGYRGLRAGETALVTVTLAGGDTARPALRLEVPAGLRVETPGVWISSLREMSWRVRVVEAGSHSITLDLAGTRIVKSLDATPLVIRRSPERLRATLVKQLLYPAEDPLPAGVPLRAIAVTCPEASICALGISLHWLVWFFVLSMAFAFALRKRFGVVL
jgi:uncharacterized membrane protein (DUF106 family)